MRGGRRCLDRDFSSRSPISWRRDDPCISRRGPQPQLHVIPGCNAMEAPMKSKPGGPPPPPSPFRVPRRPRIQRAGVDPSSTWEGRKGREGFWRSRCSRRLEIGTSSFRRWFTHGSGLWARALLPLMTQAPSPWLSSIDRSQLGIQCREGR